jgi:hypothetical protein
MWYIHTVEYYSAIKKNEILLFTSKWMELENIMLTKVNQAQKEKGQMFSHMWKTDPNTSTTICMYIDIHTQKFPKVGLLEESK